MLKVILLGATGSIGTQTLDIIRANKDKYQLLGVSFYHNVSKIMEIIDEFKPLMVASPNATNIESIKIKYLDILAFTNIDDLLKYRDATIVVNAITGYDGFHYSYVALKQGFNLYLANKESLVVGGQILKKMADLNNLKIIPIDSEHTSLLDLVSNSQEKIVKYFITASGGPFYKMTKNQLANIKPSDALKHPNWQMGKHITINSATMVNKLFEIVEASYLFDLNDDNLFVLVDQKSKIHAGIILENNQVRGHFSPTDMHFPIEYALSFPNNLSYNQDFKKYDYQEFIDQNNLEFLSAEQYPVLRLKTDILTKNSFSGIIITTVNDLLVDKFLNGKISFLDITDKILAIHERVKKQFIDLPYNIQSIEYVKEYLERRIDEL